MKPSFFDKLKQVLVVTLISALLPVVPFYFRTSAMIDQNTQATEQHSRAISEIKSKVQELEVTRAVNDTEIRQINQRLERIEKKIDRLIEERH